MSQETDPSLDYALKQSGYRQDAGDPKDTYYQVTANGVEKVYTDGNWYRKADSNEWERYVQGKTI